VEIELAWSTPDAWAERALRDPVALLSDHAWCELGAASTAQALIARHPARAALVERMAGLAAEEMRHFQRVLRVLRELPGALAPASPNPYASAMLALARGEREAAPLDRLLLAALIERRSLERFELLARDASEPLAGLYRELAPSEEGHARLFVELAREVAGAEVATTRLAELTRREGEIARSLPFSHRIHSGPPVLEPAARTSDTREPMARWLREA
jgi:tRNA-(ms[2]io[6]A)-hydroxylase